MNPPLRAKYVEGGTEAEILDDGSRITLTLKVQGKEPFMAMLERKRSRVDLSRYVEVQDVAGAGYVDPANWRSGVGRFMANTVIQYLQRLNESEYAEVRGHVYHVPGAEPEGHEAERVAFFEAHNAAIDDAGSAHARITDLRVIPAPFPFTDGPPQVVPLDRFSFAPLGRG